MDAERARLLAIAEGRQQVWQPGVGAMRGEAAQGAQAVPNGLGLATATREFGPTIKKWPKFD